MYSNVPIQSILTILWLRKTNFRDKITIQRGTVNLNRMGYDIRTLITLSVSLLFICGMVELLSTYNFETIEKRIRGRNVMENESVGYTSLGHRTTSIVTSRRNNIEIDLMPISELESKCDINLYEAETSFDNITTAYTNIDVEYWFAIGTTANKFNDLSLFQLHQYVYTSVQESNIWCTSSATSSSDSNSTTTSKLGTITFIPALLVPSTNVFCQTKAFLPEMSETINTTKSLNCFVMTGTMQILSQSISTTSVATYALQKELQNAITLASKEASMIEGISILSYLGNTAEDAVAFLASLSRKNDPTVGSIVEVTNESPSENKSPVVFVFAVGVPLVLVAILSMFLIKRRALRKNDVNAIQSWEEYDPTTNVLKGTGDPPDSFHDGLYHYMKHGQQQYLSTRCTLCLETRRNIYSGVYAEALKFSTSGSTFDNILPKQYRKKAFDTNDEEDEAYQLARARSNMKLGQYHMGMDVHVCQSATCARCMANQAPMFVPTGIVRCVKSKGTQPQQNSTNDYVDDNSSLSSSESPTSRNSIDDNQSYETKSTFNRDVCTPLPIPMSPPKRKGRRWYSK